MPTDVLTILCSSAVLAATTPTEGDVSAWSQWGLAGLVVAFTLWRDDRRERRMAAAMERQQVWIRDTLTSTIQHNTVALHDVGQALGGRRLTASGTTDLQAVEGA